MRETLYLQISDSRLTLLLLNADFKVTVSFCFYSVIFCVLNATVELYIVISV